MTDYGLKETDMGDWVRGNEPKGTNCIENLKTGFKVYCQYPNIRFDLGTRYIVCKSGFCIGFNLSKHLAMHHVEYPPDDTPKIFVDSVGGLFRSDSAVGEKGFITLADRTHFTSEEQQEEFFNTLIDAAPRIPATGSHAFRWDGGFGYQIEFTEEIKNKITNGDLRITI